MVFAYVRGMDEKMCLTRKCKMIFLSVLLFSLEFSVRFTGFITLRKIALVTILILYGLKYRFKSITLSQKDILIALLFVGLFLYTVLIVNVFSKINWYGSNEIYRTKNILFMILNIVIFPLLLIPLFTSTLQFAKCQWYITLFQSLIILAGRLFLNFRMFIFQRFTYDDGRLQEGIEKGIRSVGIDMAGSTGSIILFAGLLCAIYIFFHSDIKGKKKILIEYFIVMAALLFVGRLGLYLGLTALLIVCGICVLHRDFCAKVIICYLVLGISLLALYIVMAPDSYGLQAWVRWITELFRLFDEKSTISVLRNMSIPSLTLETLFGTGIQYGTTASGLVLNHDAGYVRMYTAIGLFGCFYYYGTIYGYFLAMVKDIKKRTVCWFYLFFIFSIAIAEMKEPFLGKTPLVMILACMLILETKKRVNRRKY